MYFDIKTSNSTKWTYMVYDLDKLWKSLDIDWANLLPFILSLILIYL